MTRILLVHQPTDGGVGRHMKDLAEGLTERGHEVVLCGPALPDGIAGFPHEQLAMQRAVAPRTDLAAVASLAKIVPELRPDVVHAHSSKAGAVARLARLAHPRVPLLYSPHMYAFAGDFARHAERRAYLTYRGVELMLAPAASRVVCVCDAEAQLARSIGPARRVRVVHNGIAPAGDGPLDPRIAELAHRGPVVGALALLSPRKGLKTLIDATPQVLARHPRMQVAIVGEGPDLEALRAQAHLLNVTHAVHFLGPSTEPLSALRGMEVFVHPSLAEAFPYVVLEAMSLGRPIIASDVGGTREAIVDRESGLLMHPGDKETLAHALIALLDDADWRARLGRAAQHRLEQRFTSSAMIDRMTSLYDEVL